MNFFRTIVSSVLTLVAAFASARITNPLKDGLNAEATAFARSLEVRANAAVERAAELEEAAANLAATATRERRYAKHANLIADAVTNY
jgi:hypothetical protein